MDKNERYVPRSESYANRGSGVNNNAVGNRYDDDRHAEQKVEEWTYNFGRNKLMRRVRFVNGVVEVIETLEYGYAE